MDWLEITLIGLIAGISGTGTGGLTMLFWKRPSDRFMGAVLGFSAGIMLSIVFLELVEEALAISGLWTALAGLSTGLLVFWLLDNYLPHSHLFSAEKKYGSYLKKGMLIAVGIALHNFPEGLAIGAGYTASPLVGLTLAILIAVHNIPEGIAVAMPLRYGGSSKLQVLAITALAGTPMGAGAFLGAVIGSISPFVLSLSLGFAAGAMLYIVCDELIPDAYQVGGTHLPILGISTGVILGVILTARL
ncbi:MAG: ZIP family metal transporter [Bacillota bacterium]